MEIGVGKRERGGEREVKRFKWEKKGLSGGEREVISYETYLQ